MLGKNYFLQKHFIGQKKKSEFMKNQVNLSDERIKKIKGKSIESLFRTLSKNNYRLQQMIDRKANILISVNSIILSIIISIKFVNIATFENQNTIIILTLSAAISIFFALAAVRPFVINTQMLNMKSNNLLNIEAIKSNTIDQYKTKMNEVLENDNSVYDSMTEDIFFIGKNIHRKHILLQLSASIFFFGLLISAFSVLI